MALVIGICAQPTAAATSSTLLSTPPDPNSTGFCESAEYADRIPDPWRFITWVLSGALEHRDSLRNGSIIRPGDAQRMTAGRGFTYSEFNPSPEEPGYFP